MLVYEGVVGILVLAVISIFCITTPVQGMVYSKMLLSIQLPITVFLQIYLTSSEKLMGKYKNSYVDRIALWVISIILTVLNVMLFMSYL